MITDAILHVLLVPITFLLAHLPSVPFSSYLTGRGDGTLYASISGGMSSLAGVNGWLPIGQLVAALGLVVACVAAGLAIRVTRIVASFLTLGGGA